jgi:hypothetical protein
MVHDHLSKAPLLVSLADPPPDGGDLLDAQSLQARFPGCRFMLQPATEVMEMFVASRYDALCLNPAGECVSWTRAKASKVIEAGRVGPG